jgi:CHAT domain-containing protein/tetratricopeptide (TPR) repeat protein
MSPRAISTCIAFAVLSLPGIAPPLLAAAEPERVRLADDFAANSLEKYRIAGAVAWQKGRITLKEGSSIERPAEIGSVAAVRAVVQLPDSKEDLDLVFVFKGQKQKAALVLRQTAGKLTLVNRGNPEEVVALTAPEGAREWVVRGEWQYGLLRAKAWPSGGKEPNGWQTIRMAHEDFDDLQCVSILAEKGPGASMMHLEISGEAAKRWSDEGKEKQFEQAVQLWGEATQLNGRGKYADAAARCQQAVDLATKAISADFCFTILFRRDLVVMRRNVGNYWAARSLAASVLEDATKVFGPDHPHTATAHNHLALAMYYLNEDRGAGEHWRAALAIHERARGGEHADVALTLDNLGALASRQGKYVEARKHHERALPIFRKTRGGEHIDTLACMENLGIALLHLNDTEAAEKLLREALAGYRKSLPEDHPAMGMCIANLGCCLHQRGLVAESRPLLEKAAEHCRRYLGPRHPLTLQVLNNLGVALSELGDLAAARPVLEAALAVRRQVLPADSPQIADNLVNLAALLRDMDRLESAAKYYRQALAINRKVRPDHPHTAINLRSLGFVLLLLRDVRDARRCYEEALPLFEKRYGPDAKATAEVRFYFGGLLAHDGDQVEARRQLERASSAVQKAYGKDSREAADALAALGSSLNQAGDPLIAIDLLEQALAIYRKRLSTDAVETVAALMALGLARLHHHEPEKAAACWEEARTLVDRRKDQPDDEKRPRKDHPPTQRCDLLNMLGYYRLSQEEPKKAIPLLEESLRLSRIVYGPDNRETVIRENNLVMARFDAGDGEAGRKGFEAVLPRAVQAFGANHPATTGIHGNLARALERAGDKEAAWREQVVATRASVEHLRHFASAGSRRDHAVLRGLPRVEFEILMVLADRRDSLSAAQRDELFALVLDIKAFGAQVEGDRQEALALGDDRQARAVYAQLRSVRQRLADTILQGAGPVPAKNHETAINNLQKLELRLERDLADRTAGFAATRAARRAGPAEIAPRLPPGAVLVEVVKYAHGTLWPTIPQADQPRGGYWAYAALLLGRDADGRPQTSFVSLGPAEPIEAAITAWRAVVQKGGRDARTDEALRRLAWEPIARLLPEKTERLFLAPDGEFALLPFEAIQLSDGSYLVERYGVSYVSCGRDLMPRAAPKEKPGPAVLVADPDFDAAAATSSSLSLPLNPAPRPGTLTLRFATLPGFAREADAVEKLLRDGKCEVRSLRRGEATEEAVAAAARPRLLYLVTHGFFLPGHQEPVAPPTVRGLSLVEQGSGTVTAPPLANDPLMRCGLALSGANRWQERGRAGASDGLLTALEVENLDLWGTELVVLSACETEVGERQLGEGALGLRHSFREAGARTVVASLWKVPDRETEQLMTRFLALWLSGTPKAEALRQAQRELIARLRDSGDAKRKGAPPLYWAGFICHGQPE